MPDFAAVRRDSLARYLSRHVAGEVRFDPSALRAYATAGRPAPVGVVLPRSADDVAAAVDVAADLGVAVVPRGGGSHPAGRATGPGLLVDCSKYLTGVGPVDPAAGTVWAEAGATLGAVNRALAGRGLAFAPDPWAADQSTVGGAIAADAAGPRAVLHGRTAAHVKAVDAVLADGSRATFRPLTGREFDRKCELRTREGDGYRGVRAAGTPAPPSVVPYLCGSMGTLAVAVGAELRVARRPRAGGLLVPHFAAVSHAVAAVPVCLAAGASAVELVDRTFLAVARELLGEWRTAVVSPRAGAVLVVEFAGESAADVADRAGKLAARLKWSSGVTAVVSAVDPAARDGWWAVAAGVAPARPGTPGRRRPVSCVGETGVAPAWAGELVAAAAEIGRRHGVEVAFAGSAGAGGLHVCPVVDPLDPAGAAAVGRVAAEVGPLAVGLGGRPALLFPVADRAVRVKPAFDPAGLLGPPPEPPAPPPAGGFFRSAAACTGVGVCRRTHGGAMCPSFRATADERHSPRGRAAAARSTGGRAVGRADRWLFDVMDLCLGCKGCKAECPSGVDVGKLKAEFLHAYYADRRRPAGHLLAKNVDLLLPLAARWAGAANWLGRRKAVRGLLEAAAGVDRRRSLPAVHGDHLRRWFRRRPAAADPGRPRVVVLDDCFTTYQEPHIGRAAVGLLERAGYAVELAGVCCGRAMLAHGFLPTARDLARAGVRKLARAARAGVPVVGVEPACLLALTDEWPDLVPGPDARAVAAAADLADGWVAAQAAAGRFPVRFAGGPTAAALHPHCHQAAAGRTHGSAAALRLIPGLDVAVLAAGCCGMAGAFGYEVDHYPVSVRVAEVGLLPALAGRPEAVVVAPGRSCRHQVRDLTGRPAAHPVELLWAAAVAAAESPTGYRHLRGERGPPGPR